MKITNKILTAILICLPMVGWADVDVFSITGAKDTNELQNNTGKVLKSVLDNEKYKDIPQETKDQILADANKAMGFDTGTKSSVDKKKVADAQKKLDEAKANQQSLANRTLTAASIATMGIGGMQLAQGIAEKQADSAADKDMEAYIATMRCTYGGGHSVKFGTEPIELPSGNNSELMKYRSEYIALATSLKERKTALDLKPGIEAEEILDKATAGLYDDENVGITGGAYASRYRAAAGNDKDSKGLASAKKEAKNRMIAGGVIAGVGLVGSMVGNSIINGKLGELIKESRADKKKSKDHDATVKSIKQALKAKGYTNVDSLNFDNVDVGALKDADFSKLKEPESGKRDATSLISTANATSLTSSFKDLGVQGTED
ncbi:MAG: hypothetical protein IJL05_03595 [Alphaproteobacteria bacterium]|nr:hypothetical protein [Alphaproteobacteria bacterium]